MTAEQDDDMARKVARSIAESVLSSYHPVPDNADSDPLPYVSTRIWRQGREVGEWHHLGCWDTDCLIVPDEPLIWRLEARRRKADPLFEAHEHPEPVTLKAAWRHVPGCLDTLICDHVLPHYGEFEFEISFLGDSAGAYAVGFG